jgi:hypothetical protein
VGGVSVLPKKQQKSFFTQKAEENMLLQLMIDLSRGRVQHGCKFNCLCMPYLNVCLLFLLNDFTINEDLFFLF